MKFGLMRLGWVVPAGLLFAGLLQAQQLPPIEAPKPMPGAHADSPTIRVTTNEVLVPTLWRSLMGAASSTV